MLAALAFATLCASTLVVNADPTPTTPSPGSVYNEGANCPIAWTPDASGTWTSMVIQLMSGQNLDMITLMTVATVDGTDANNASYSYPCPEVTPNSAIYFYQFTDPASKAYYWTTRFAIADASGNTTPPPNATQPNGQAVPWGNGALIDGSSSSPGSGSAPGNGTSSSPASPAPSSPAAPTPVASTPTSSVIQTIASAPSKSASPSPSPSPSAGSDSSIPSSADALSARIVPTLVAFALVFACLL